MRPVPAMPLTAAARERGMRAAAGHASGIARAEAAGGDRAILRAHVAALRAALLTAERMLTADDHAALDAPSLEDWYRTRAATLPHSSEKQDQLDALAIGFPASRVMIRDLRRRLAPDHWQRPGQRARISPLRRI